MSHFRVTSGGVQVELTVEERLFLGDVLPLLAGVGASGSDPAADRLNVPVYLDDPESNGEWWRLMGPELTEARRADRAVLARVVAAEGPMTVTVEEADAMLRVLNEARLTLGARFGIDVESDHDDLPEDSRLVMDYLGWIQEELTIELLRSM